MNDVASPVATCHNCGAPLHGPFCAACGQESRALDPPLAEVARDLVHELFDFDGRLLRSVRQLFLSPGFLTRELFQGRRIPWLTPLRLYLIFSVLYFTLVALGGTDVRVRVTGESDSAIAAELKKYGFTSVEELRRTVVQTLAIWMPRVNFALVPLFAGLVALVRRRSGRRYPQHLLFALHAHAAWFGVRAAAAAGGQVSPEFIGSALDGLSILYGMVYVVIALRVAYGITTRRAIRDTVIVLGIYFICVAAATLGVILPALFWHKGGPAPGILGFDF